MAFLDATKESIGFYRKYLGFEVAPVHAKKRPKEYKKRPKEYRPATCIRWGARR
jgi:hypothetical protein